MAQASCVVSHGKMNFSVRLAANGVSSRVVAGKVLLASISYSACYCR